MPSEKTRRGGGFTLLWVGSALGEFAYSTSLIVLPLIVLALTGSPARAGIIGFVDAAAMLLAGLPAGAIADRYDRRTVMLWCQAALVAVFGALALLLWAGTVSLPALVALALVNGVSTALTMAAGEAMIPSLVAEERLSDAVAMNAARTYAGQLAGTSAGGFLLALKNALPFVVGCLAHLAALVMLLFLKRQPPAAGVPADRPVLSGRGLLEGIRWITSHPFLRVGLLCATATNFFFGVIYFVVIASARTGGMATGLIGVMAALLGVGGLLGSLAAPLLQRVLTGARPIHVVLWAFVVLTVGIAVLPGAWTPGVLLGAIAFAAPTANACFTTYQLRLTPDSHRGRVVSVAAIASGGGGAIAPLAGGIVLDLAGRFAGLLGCAAVMAVIALLTSLSPALRDMPQPGAAVTARPDADAGNSCAGEVLDADAAATPPPVR
ncbi:MULTISPECIES: MFS transporter [unclassified Streptomyces]|uniref:MFS transporter n=1 Tax=unclassified Streptomyces TaxID=2593676 RepID=UPI0013198982|nr:MULTISPECIES: MFS transporter [unclassified Streptomyces]QHC31840.1 MFS transporter [Streptomyces sp. HF10]WKE69183.1 MFS transporter [Streptomyces sp. WP-1]